MGRGDKTVLWEFRRERSSAQVTQEGCLEKEAFEYNKNHLKKKKKKQKHFQKLYGNWHFSEQISEKRIMDPRRAVSSQDTPNHGGQGTQVYPGI